MGRKKKYNFKGVLNTSPFSCFEFEEMIPINCWNCKHQGGLCNNSGKVSNRFCLNYTPNILTKEVRDLIKYIPEDEFNENLLEIWQK